MATPVRVLWRFALPGAQRTRCARYDSLPAEVGALPARRHDPA